MPKTTSAAMDTMKAGSTTYFVSMLKIVRLDGVEFHYTSNIAPVSFGGDTYLPQSGFSRSPLTNDPTTRANTAQALMAFNDAQASEADLRGGLFDGAEVFFFEVDWRTPDATGDLKMARGKLGRFQPQGDGSFQAEMRSMIDEYSQNTMRVYGNLCDVDLGSAKCGVPIQPPVLDRNAAVVVGEFYRVPTLGGATAPYDQEDFENRIYRVTVAGTTAGTQPTYDETPGNTTTDGTATLMAHEAWTRHATVTRVVDRSTFEVEDFPEADGSGENGGFPDDWFTFGAVQFDTGNNANVVIARQVKSFVNATTDPGDQIVVPADIDADDDGPNALTATVGANAQQQTAVSKFGGGSMEFSPSSGTDQTSIIDWGPTQAAWALTDTLDWTVEGWVRFKDLTASVQLIAGEGDAATTSRRWLLYKNGSNFNWQAYNTSGTFLFQFSGAWPSLVVDTWYSWAVVHTAASDLYEGYIGTSRVFTGTNATAFGGSGQDLMVGTNRNANNQQLYGFIDEFKVSMTAKWAGATRAEPTGGVSVAELITTFRPFPFDIQIGDKLKVAPGCDKQKTGNCFTKYFIHPDSPGDGNVINHRGFDDLPGPDWAYTFPDAS